MLAQQAGEVSQGLRGAVLLEKRLGLFEGQSKDGFLGAQSLPHFAFPVMPCAAPLPGDAGESKRQGQTQCAERTG